MKILSEISTAEEWNELKKQTQGYEILIFKYSPRCSISRSVEREFDRWFQSLPADKKLNCAKVNVISARPLSMSLAEELKIVHQSPQAIWLKENSEVKWHGSHYDIDSVELDKLL